MQTVLDDCNLILNERAENRLMRDGRGERHEKVRGDGFIFVAVTESPDDVLAIPQGKPMLQVHVVSVVPDYGGSIPLLQVVVVHLQGQLGGFREVVGPVAKNVAAINVFGELGGVYEGRHQ